MYSRPMTTADPATLPPAFLRVKASASYLGIGPTKLYELVGQGHLHPVRLDRRTVFSVRELQAFASKRATEAGVPVALYGEPEPIGAR